MNNHLCQISSVKNVQNCIIRNSTQVGIITILLRKKKKKNNTFYTNVEIIDKFIFQNSWKNKYGIQ